MALPAASRKTTGSAKALPNRIMVRTFDPLLNYIRFEPGLIMNSRESRGGFFTCDPDIVTDDRFRNAGGAEIAAVLISMESSEFRRLALCMNEVNIAACFASQRDKAKTARALCVPDGTLPISKKCRSSALKMLFC